jgi:hypothetical protein
MVLQCHNPYCKHCNIQTEEDNLVTGSTCNFISEVLRFDWAPVQSDDFPYDAMLLSCNKFEWRPDDETDD